MKKHLFKSIISTLLCALMMCSVIPGIMAVDTDENSAPIMEVPDGYNLFEFSKLYSGGALSIEAGDSKAALTADDANGGLIISGKPSEIEKITITLKDEIDLGSLTAGRLVVNALSEVRYSSEVNVTVDDKDAFAVETSRQKKAGVWTGEKNKCVDLSALKLSGKHKIKLGLKFKDGVADKKTNVMLKNMLFVAYSVPVVDVNIDESLGSIDAMNGDKKHNTECYGDMTVNIPENYKSEYTDNKLTTQTYEFEYIRGRGNSTWDADKKPYKVKLKKKAELLGMGANKHWGLIANYYDYSFIRNKYTYWLGAKLGMEYTPKCVPVDVVMNGSYLGSYCLSELIRLDKNRVDLDELDESVTSGEELTGGYLLNCNTEPKNSSFTVNYNDENDVQSAYYSVESPDFDETMVPEQLEYIKNYCQNIYDAVYSDDFCDKNGVPYSDYLDVDSMVDYYIIQGTSDNGDAFGNGSTYLYKKRGGKLYWGPLWDFDYVAWAATDFKSVETDVVMQYSGYPLFKQLYTKNSEFKEKFDKRIKEIDDVIAESVKDGGQVDKYAKDVYLSQFADHQLIPSTVFEEKQNAPEEDKEKYDVTYDEEITRFKNWLISRTNYQSENLDKIIPAKKTAKFYADGEVVYEFEFDFFNPEEVDAPTPTADGKEFLYWYTETEKGEIKLEDYDPIEDPDEIKFYAKWKEKSDDDTISLNKKSVSLNSGKTCTLTVKNFKASKWLSSNPSVASVKNGKVTALKKGSAEIYAVLSNNYYLVCKVNVKNNPTIKINGKKFNAKKTYSVKKGGKLTVKITGKASTVKNSYKSTNKKIGGITSKSGAKKLTLKAYKKGKATVSVKINGVSYKIKVKVK